MRAGRAQKNFVGCLRSTSASVVAMELWRAWQFRAITGSHIHSPFPCWFLKRLWLMSDMEDFCPQTQWPTPTPSTRAFAFKERMSNRQLRTSAPSQESFTSLVSLENQSISQGRGISYNFISIELEVKTWFCNTKESGQNTARYAAMLLWFIFNVP